VAGRPLQEFAEAMGRPWTPEDRASTEDEVVNAAYRIIRGKGATYYGVAAAIARAVDVLVRDRRSILTVSAWSPAYGCALSLPRLVCGAGVVRRSGCRSTRTSVSGSSARLPCCESTRPPSATDGTHDARTGEDRLTLPLTPGLTHGPTSPARLGCPRWSRRGSFGSGWPGTMAGP